MTRPARFELTYDPQADVLGIWFPGPDQDVRTREIAPGVHVDLTPEGRVTAIQILDARARYPLPSLRALDGPVDWITLVEAAREAGLKPDTLRRQVANGRLEARKRGRDWLVSRSALWTYLDGRAPSGRAPASRRGQTLRRRSPAPAR
jgi:excisionase family DNA binding protein